MNRNLFIEKEMWQYLLVVHIITIEIRLYLSSVFISFRYRFRSILSNCWNDQKEEERLLVREKLLLLKPRQFISSSFFICYYHHFLLVCLCYCIVKQITDCIFNWSLKRYTGGNDLKPVLNVSSAIIIGNKLNNMCVYVFVF